MKEFGSEYKKEMKNEMIFKYKNWSIKRGDKEELLNQKGVVLWMTGLSGSGKSTLANQLEKKLFDKGYLTIILDGDDLRSGLNTGLGFSNEGRVENIRRTAEVAKILINAGIIVIVSLITPIEEMRTMAKHIIGEDNFKLIYIDTPLEVCNARDTKGLYKLAKEGGVQNFTGVNTKFDIPRIFFKKIKGYGTDSEGRLDDLIDTIISDFFKYGK